MARKKAYGPDEKILFLDPKSERQKEALDVIAENDITFLLGPAGSSKTHTAVYCAVREMEEQNNIGRRIIRKIVITRPIVEAGEKLGALPGEVDEKVHPYMLPIYDCLAKMITGSEKFIADHIEIAPLAFMRGRNLENCVAILDEAQNCTIGQIKLFLTRLGHGGKMIITGDTDQSDIGKASGLRAWADNLKSVKGIGFVEFTEEDIIRHPLVREVLKRAPRVN